MSENERMERARRIRRMREGQRDGEDGSPETDAAGGADGTTAADGTADTDETADGAATASTDGGAAAATRESKTDDSGAVAQSKADGAVDAAAGNVGGTRAELPSAEQMAAAMEQTTEQADQAAGQGEADAGDDDGAEAPAGPAAGIAGDTKESTEADTRVLEFTLDDEQYCLDIEYIEEIVKHTSITRVPNTPEFVEGVVDLRGQITTILNPKVAIDKPNKAAGELVVVFDSEAFEDQGHIGWVVDDVRQVAPISEDDVNDPPMQEPYINGVIDREDGEFVIWTTPDLALDQAD